MNFQEIIFRAESEWKNLQNRIHLRIGTATCGRAAGALEVMEAFEERFSREGMEVPILPVGCMGLCYAEPLVIISKPEALQVVYQHITPSLVSRLIDGYIIGDDPCLELALGTLEINQEGIPYIPELLRFEYEFRYILRYCGYINPLDINQYISLGGYRALAKALQMRPKKIIEEIKKSGLRGRGGAGFPTGKKWEFCFYSKGEPKYVICNGDEGDPGAFMDRVILESNPHEVIEGMIIAGYAVGAEKGYIYVRAEYPLAIEHTRFALLQAEEMGLLGDNILDSGFNFHIDIEEGAGAFVSGEATALIAALEGKRSEPRLRPPRLTEAGLWGKPTLLNNVKTFSYVPLILERGSDWFAAMGTEKSKGTAVFTLAGKVQFTGLTEVPMGTTLRSLVDDIGGGMRNGRKFKAVQIGGPSGGCIPESLADLPIDFDSLHEAGSMMGSGGMIFMDEDDCVVDTAKFFLEFITKESCGKCSICRIGTVQLLSILEDITSGRANLNDLDQMEKLAQDVKEGSLCGLGRSAPNPILTTLRYFRDEYLAHILEKRCPALVCKELLVYYIIPEKCERACEHCVLTCPTDAIKGDKGEIKIIDQDKCSKCGTCLEVCPKEYSAVIKVSPVNKILSNQ